MTQEARVGLFLLAGLAALTGVILVLGDFQFQRTYTLKVLFNDISGLPAKAPVKIAGVAVGKVTRIALVKDKAEVQVEIRQGVVIRANARVTVITTGVIGTKYLEMTLGMPPSPALKDGDTVMGIDPVSYEQIVGKVMTGIDSLIDTLHDIGGEQTVKGIMSDLKAFSTDVRAMAGTLNDITQKHKGDIESTFTTARGLGDRLEKTLDRVDGVLENLQHGDGTAGRLLNDKKMGEEVKETVANLRQASEKAKSMFGTLGGSNLDWEYRQHYNLGDSRFRPEFGLRYMTGSKTSYDLGLYNIREETAAPDERIGTNRVTAQIGKGFGPIGVRAGMYRSKGGVGLDVRPVKPLMLSADTFWFTRATPGLPWVNLGGSVNVTRWLRVGAGMEDVAAPERSLNAFGSIVLTDQDVAHLMSVIGVR